MRRSVAIFALALVIGRGAAISPASETDAFATASDHYRAERWSEACEAFAALLKATPNHPRVADARFYYGEALAQRGRHAQAREQFAELLAAAPEHPLAQRALFRIGEAAYRDGDAAAAWHDLAVFAERHPDDELNAYALAYLGNLELQAGRADRARERFQEVLTRFKDAATVDECRLGLAEAAYAEGNFEAASQEFTQLTQRQVAGDLVARGLSGLGWCRFRLSDWSGAADAFGRLAAELPDSGLATEASLMCGRALEHEQKYGEALERYSDLLKRDLSDAQAADARWCAARMNDQLGQSREAIALYSRLVEGTPDFAHRDTAIYRWSWLARELGQAAEADRLCEQLRREFPQSPLAADATLRLAEAAFDDSNYDDACKLLDEIPLDKAPEGVRPHVLYLSGRAEMARGRWTQAEAALTQLVEQFPTSDLSVSAAYQLGEAAFRQGRFEEAATRLAELERRPAAAAQPWFATAVLRRAQALAQAKQWEDALAVAGSIADRFPQYAEQPEADYVIGRALVAKAELAAAREAFAKVVRSPRAANSETAAMARFMMGETYFHQEDFAAAVSEYETLARSSAFGRWQAAALLQAGKCHEALNEPGKAARDYEQLLAAHAENPLAAEARRRAAALTDRAAATAPRSR